MSPGPEITELLRSGRDANFGGFRDKVRSATCNFQPFSKTRSANDTSRDSQHDSVNRMDIRVQLSELLAVEEKNLKSFAAFAIFTQFQPNRIHTIHFVSSYTNPLTELKSECNFSSYLPLKKNKQKKMSAILKIFQ